MSQTWPSGRPGRRRLSRRALLVIQQSTEPRTPTNAARASTKPALLDKPILEPLMIPFAMVVINKFPESPSEMALTERHHPIEALVCDRPHGPFSVGVRIGRLKGRQRDVHASIVQFPTYVPAPLPVTIADQHAIPAQKAIGCGQRATDLAHEEIVWIRRRPDNPDPP